MAEEKEQSHHRELISSYEALPPNMSELRLVLLGNSWSGTCSVGNFILGQTVFRHSDHCEKSSGQYRGKNMVLVKTPNLLHPDLSEASVSALMEDCVELSAPGPHVFILVLQPEDFSEQQKNRLQSVLENFSDQAFQHSLLLLLSPRRGDSLKHYRQQSPLKDLIKQCRFRYLKQEDMEPLELITRVGQIVKENNGEHVSSDGLHLTVQLQTEGSEASADCLRITLMGRTGCGKSSSGNTILGRTKFTAVTSVISVTQSCEKAEAEVGGRHITVVDTPGLFQDRMSNEEVIGEMTKCISLLAPGPHVFLLVLELGRFTEEMNETIDLIRNSFGKESQKYTMILFTHGDKLEGESSIEEYVRNSEGSLKKLLSDCGNRFHVFNNEDQTNVSQVKELLKKIDVMVEENGGGCFTNDMFQHAEVNIKKEMERIMKEKEEEMRREREEMERKYQQEMEKIKQEMEKQKEQTEKDRKQREQELREKEEKIQIEEEQRKKKLEKRKEEERKRREQEERQRQDLERKQKELEEKIKSESESKEAIEQKLQESRRKMEEQKEKWEKEREEWWQKRKQEDEERQQYLKILREEYDRQRLKDQEQRREEDRTRKQQEEENIEELKKKYEKEIEDSKKEARVRAEEEFQRKEKEKLEEHRKNINNLVKCICRKDRNVKRINKKIKADEEQMKKETDQEKKEALLKDHERELSELIQEMLEEEDDSTLHKILKSLMFPLVYQVYEDYWLVGNEDKAQVPSTIPDATSTAVSSTE